MLLVSKMTPYNTIMLPLFPNYSGFVFFSLRSIALYQHTLDVLLNQDNKRLNMVWILLDFSYICRQSDLMYWRNNIIINKHNHKDKRACYKSIILKRSISKQKMKIFVFINIKKIGVVGSWLSFGVFLYLLEWSKGHQKLLHLR